MAAQDIYVGSAGRHGGLGLMMLLIVCQFFAGQAASTVSEAGVGARGVESAAGPVSAWPSPLWASQELIFEMTLKSCRPK